MQKKIFYKYAENIFQYCSWFDYFSKRLLPIPQNLLNSALETYKSVF